MAGIFSTECATCKVLQEALEFERLRNKELTETLTSLIKPAPVIQEVKPTNHLIPRPAGVTFSRRRAELERADRLRAEAENSPHRAKPDNQVKPVVPQTVEQLEKELGVVDSESKGA